MDLQITVYISDNCKYCQRVLDMLNESNVRYEVKNVTQEKNFMKELQGQGIFGTPATYIHRNDHFILGLQTEKLKKVLNIK
ncbi:glutaredoxin family protein [Ornithinibacillus caprae]|nr:glutaredoxin domain-containing protein [Ornithinibacillus caprae]